MALQDDLNAAVTALTTAQAQVGQAITDEIARVNATIAALQAGSAGGSVPDAVVQAAIANLQTATQNLTANAATLAGEDPAPASSPAATGGSAS